MLLEFFTTGKVAVSTIYVCIQNDSFLFSENLGCPDEEEYLDGVGKNCRSNQQLWSVDRPKYLLEEICIHLG